MFIAWHKRQQDSRWLFGLTIGAALGLASAPLFFGLILAMGIGLTSGHGDNSAESTSSFSPEALRLPLIVGGVLLASISTLGLAVPSGFGATAGQIGDWFGRFRLGADWHLPLVALLRYEAIPILLGIITIVMTFRSKYAVTRSLLFWLAAGIVLTLVQAGTMANVAIITIPLFLLVGAWAEEQFSKLADRSMWIIGVATFVWGVTALVNIGRFVKSEANIASPFVALTLLLVLVFSVAYFLPHLPTALQGGLLGMLALWAYVGWGTAWTLTHETGNDPRELWVTEAVDSDIKLMRETLKEASFQLSRSNTGLQLVSSVDHPALRWYLRDFENATFVTGIGAGNSAEAVISPALESPTLNGNYAKADFDFMQSEVTYLETGRTRDLFRYWFFNNTNATLQPEKITLWLKLE